MTSNSESATWSRDTDMITLLQLIKTTGHNIKWDNFDILASGKTDYHSKVKETLFIQDLQPAHS